jgi:hypothetical protein
MKWTARSMYERLFGVLVICLGAFVAYPQLAVYKYIETGQIVFDRRNGPAVHILEAAFWHVSIVLIGLWVVAYGLGLSVRRDSRGREPY